MNAIVHRYFISIIKRFIEFLQSVTSACDTIVMHFFYGKRYNGEIYYHTSKLVSY